MRALGPDDTDAARPQRLDQAGDVRLLAREPGEIDQHGLTLEERGRPLDLRVQRGEPFAQRRLRREDQRHEGAATHANDRTGLGCC